MEQQPSPPFKAALNYGLFTAAGMLIFSVILFLTDMEKNPVLPYFSYVILLAGILIGSLNYRDHQLGGFITYGKAFTVGFLTAVVAAVIMGIWGYLYLKFINAGLLEEAMAIAEQKMAEQGMSEAEIEEGLIMAQKFQGPGFYAFIGLFGNVLAGLILSLITSAIVKKEEPFFNPPSEGENV